MRFENVLCFVWKEFSERNTNLIIISYFPIFTVVFMFARRISYSCYTLNVSIIKRIEFCNARALRNKRSIRV